MIRAVMAFLVLAIVFWPVSQARGAQPLLFLEDPWPPYAVGDEGQDTEEGIAVEIVHEVFKRLGVGVRTQLQPWKRVLKMTETGEADGIMLLMYQEERTAFLEYTDVVFDSREVFCFNADRLGTFTWSDFQDLKDLRIGLVKGYTYTDELLKAIEEVPLQVEYAASSEENLRKLHAGRLDLVEDDEAVINKLLVAQPEWRAVVRMADKPVAEFPFHMAFSKKSEAVSLLPEVNRVISELQAEGFMDKLLGRAR